MAALSEPSRPYLLQVADTMWPGSAPARLHAGGTRGGTAPTFLAVPNRRAPSMLLPTARRPAAAALRAYGGHASRGARVRSRLAGAALGLGLGPVLFRDRLTVGDPAGGITAELRRILGRPVQVAVRGGPPRANRKPVLVVLAPDGAVLAFAKLATTPLAAALVRTEADALRSLAERPLASLRAPRLLDCVAWQGHSLLVQEPLPVGGAHAVSEAALVTAMAELATSQGVRSLPWGATEHAASVRARLAGTPRSAAADAVSQAVEALAACSLPLPIGCWHGDWTRWNCAESRGTVLVWDWERFATGVPVGFDVLHHELQGALARTATPSPAQPRALLATAAGRLAPLGLTARQAEVTAVAYLIEIAGRYLADDQAAAGARIGSVDVWLQPVIAEATAGLSDDREESSR